MNSNELRTSFWLTLLTVTFSSKFSILSAETQIRVGTYNLWNVMFSWDVRKHRIAEMIRESHVDIIGFQEVRADKLKVKNQLVDLQALLPEFKWMKFHPAQDVTLPEGSYQSEFIKEGIGLLSRWPILKSRVHVLTTGDEVDTNKRLTLTAQVAINDKVLVNFVVVHFSYHREQQCLNAAELLKHLASLQLANAMIVGDFNAYNDFEWPTKVFTSVDRDHAELGPCHSTTSHLLSGKVHLEFNDVWESVTQSKSSGYSFSNMPNPGLVSRPDRVLASSVFKPVSLTRYGFGNIYKKRYGDWLVLHRLQVIISTARQAYNGQTGFSCMHDCGPQGSCRCGVCVAGGNQYTCLLPDCKECTSATFTKLCLFIFIQVLMIIQLTYASVLVLRVSIHRHGRNIRQILGFNCCLCNPNLYSNQPVFNTPVVTRNSCLSKTRRIWPFFRLTPIPFLVYSIACFFLTFLLGKYMFSDLLKTAYNIMDEEYFPSDHLMLIAELEVDPNLT